jgi:cyclopropane fatty-acyl-phospholipid synthase-like methyltransferase
MSTRSEAGTDRQGVYTLEGEGHRQYMGARTAAVQAAFLRDCLQTGARVLDAGCGPGSITIGIADQLALAATAWLEWAEMPNAFQARAWIEGVGRKL